MGGCLPLSCLGVDDLAVEVGAVHSVPVNDSQAANAGPGEVEEEGGTEAAFWV